MSPAPDPTVVVTFWSGWRQPLTSVKGLELWDVTGHRGTIPGDLVLQLILQHLRQVALIEAVRARLDQPLPPMPVIESPPSLVEKSTPRLRSTHGRKLKGR